MPIDIVKEGRKLGVLSYDALKDRYVFVENGNMKYFSALTGLLDFLYCL